MPTTAMSEEVVLYSTSSVASTLGHRGQVRVGGGFVGGSGGSSGSVRAHGCGAGGGIEGGVGDLCAGDGYGSRSFSSKFLICCRVKPAVVVRVSDSKI